MVGDCPKLLTRMQASKARPGNIRFVGLDMVKILTLGGRDITWHQSWSWSSGTMRRIPFQQIVLNNVSRWHPASSMKYSDGDAAVPRLRTRQRLGWCRLGSRRRRRRRPVESVRLPTVGEIRRRLGSGGGLGPETRKSAEVAPQTRSDHLSTSAPYRIGPSDTPSPTPISIGCRSSIYTYSLLYPHT